MRKRNLNRIDETLMGVRYFIAFILLSGAALAFLPISDDLKVLSALALIPFSMIAGVVCASLHSYPVADILKDIERVECALLRLESEIRARHGEPDIKQTLLGKIHYEAYGNQASGLFSTALGVILRMREYKKLDQPDLKALLEDLENVATALANCCEEFGRVCFNIARWKTATLHKAEFSWESDVWGRYNTFFAEYISAKNKFLVQSQ